MKSIIVKSFESICRLGVIVLVLGGGVAGYAMGSHTGDIGQGAVVGVLGVVVGTLISIIVFGVLFILLDIRENTEKTAAAISSVNQGE